MLETRAAQSPVAARNHHPLQLLSLSSSNSPPGSTSLAAPFGQIEDGSFSGLLGPLGASYMGAAGLNGYSVTHGDDHISLDHHHQQQQQQEPESGVGNDETPPSNTDAADSLPSQECLTETLSPNVSSNGRSKRKPGSLGQDPSNENAMTAIKRQRNTIAARRYRQKGRNRIAELESALRDMEHERNELRLQLARREAEVAALKEMLRR
ncbi:hypothetical protein BDV26DRAFT_263107 [Aspergillus bertholletiae]|uniref:BZIP domain-containing protein n=1 Tax=Aspergillus bertholletiae TaxID=1226010 RepID=A0A5N7B744_9EURO|nr:hypothetical protein BDV26DRAFT_263107 [Aspergillus bertholletiae]